jgi:hypothetical protein
MVEDNGIVDDESQEDRNDGQGPMPMRPEKPRTKRNEPNLDAHEGNRVTLGDLAQQRIRLFSETRIDPMKSKDGIEDIEEQYPHHDSLQPAEMLGGPDNELALGTVRRSRQVIPLCTGGVNTSGNISARSRPPFRAYLSGPWGMALRPVPPPVESRCLHLVGYVLGGTVLPIPILSGMVLAIPIHPGGEWEWQATSLIEAGV